MPHAEIDGGFIESLEVCFAANACSLCSHFCLPTADFGDFNRYDSQEFLQKFALFPIVSILFSLQEVQMICIHLHQSRLAVFAGLDSG